MGFVENRARLPIQGVRIAGTGSYLPGEPIDQDRLRAILRRFDDNLGAEHQDHLIRVSGIETRHLGVDPETGELCETNTSMATAAGRRAMEAAGWQPDDVGLLVVTTVVPDSLMPPTSTLVQAELGIQNCMELEISANCTAPTKGLMVAASQVQLGVVERALVCCSQLASFAMFPPFANPSKMAANQAHLRWILSDGAGAIALERGEPGIDLRIHLESKGIDKRSGMHLDFGTAHPDIHSAMATGSNHVTQDPLYALKNGMRLADEGVRSMLRRVELPGSAVDHFIPSISSVQVVERLQKTFAKSGVQPQAWRLNFTRVGYVGSVAVPIMLDEMVKAGSLKPGDVVATAAEESSKWMFAGAVFRWNPSASGVKLE